MNRMAELEVDVRKFPHESYDQLYKSFQHSIPKYFNIGEAAVDRPAKERGDNVAIYYEDEQGAHSQHTFSELKKSSNQLANLLKDLGVTKGDIVGVFLPPRPETIVAVTAIYKLGGIALSMSPLFGSEAVKYRLMHSKAKVLIMEAERADIREVVNGIETLKHIIIVEGEPSRKKEVSFEDIKKASINFTPVRTTSDEPAHMFYTSGTTGNPKGALHAHRFLLAVIPGFQLYFDIAPQEGDIFWTAGDWGWVGSIGGVVLPALYFGMPVLAYRRRSAFNPHTALALMEKYKVTCALIPPTALRMIRKNVENPLKEYNLRVRAICSVGERVGADLVIWSKEKLGVPINETYGQTESLAIAMISSKIMRVKPGAMGRPCPGRVVEVIDENGNILPPGKVGEIAIKTPDPGIMLEYWGMPEETKKKFRGEWFLTGDYGYKDEEGYIWFKGRADDIIKVAGHRIGPDEVESIINQHPAVLESAVVPKPDPIRGNIIKAFIVLKPGFKPSKELEEEIQRMVKEKFAAYGYPREIEFIDKLPKTETGKIKRYELKQRVQKNDFT